MIRLDDVRVNQIGDELGFADEILDEHLLGRETRPNDFDGDPFDEFLRAVLLGLIDDAHAALKDFAGDFVVKFVLDCEQRHARMLENWPVKSSPTRRHPKNNAIYFCFLLARIRGNPLIPLKSHDFCN
jgi:hypothetical protein